MGSGAAWFGAVPWSLSLLRFLMMGSLLTTPPHFLTLLTQVLKIFDNLFIQWGVPIVGGTSPLFKRFLTICGSGLSGFGSFALVAVIFSLFPCFYFLYVFYILG